MIVGDGLGHLLKRKKRPLCVFSHHITSKGMAYRIMPTNLTSQKMLNASFRFDLTPRKAAIMLRVYTASKLRHAPMWRSLCATTPHLQFHARWLKHSALGTPDTPDHAVEFWLQDEQDVRDADAVLVYAEGDEHLRGALVEAGIAIAYGVPVVVVGDSPDYGTWQHHPGVTRVDDLASALLFLKSLKPRYRRVA